MTYKIKSILKEASNTVTVKGKLYNITSLHPGHPKNYIDTKDIGTLYFDPLTKKTDVITKYDVEDSMDPSDYFIIKPYPAKKKNPMLKKKLNNLTKPGWKAL